MRTVRGVHRGCGLVGGADGFLVLDQHCNEARSGWVGPGELVGHSLLLPRSGGFLVRVAGRERFIDTSVAEVALPGPEAWVSHPFGACRPATRIHFPDEIGAERLPARGGVLPRTPGFEWHHWELVAACRRGVDGFEIADRVWTLLRALPPPHAEPALGLRRPGTDDAHRRLVRSVRELLSTGEFTLGLAAAAHLVGSSAPHLSRVFRRVTGRSVTAYRNQLRLQAVLRDLADGAPCLRTLAAQYGFADQAHLTRVVRAQLGQPPSAVHRALRPQPSTDVQRDPGAGATSCGHDTNQTADAGRVTGGRTVRAAGRRAAGRLGDHADRHRRDRAG
ncbi:MAG: helix-turn-helix domain-containing protein [Micromonosporaceae bacterium]